MPTKPLSGRPLGPGRSVALMKASTARVRMSPSPGSRAESPGRTSTHRTGAASRQWRCVCCESQRTAFSIQFGQIAGEECGWHRFARRPVVRVGWLSRNERRHLCRIIRLPGDARPAASPAGSRQVCRIRGAAGWHPPGANETRRSGTGVRRPENDQARRRAVAPIRAIPASSIAQPPGSGTVATA